MARSQEFRILLEELDAANLNDPEEDKKLLTQQDRLVNGVKLQESLMIILNRLNHENADHPSVMDHLSFCVNELQKIAKLDLSLEDISDQFLNLLSSKLSF